MSSDKPFTRENLDICLRELAKEYRKRNGEKSLSEIILIGGASILINYGFREMTYDMDAIIHSSSAMKDAIRIVGDRFDLPSGWLNTDFMNTKSYTEKLITYSKYYKTFSNILQVRTISAEYLVAMKLMAGRQYKNDFSDVIGIVIEQKECGDELTLTRVMKAVGDLYGEHADISESSKSFIEKLFQQTDLKSFYLRHRETECENRDVLIEFQKNYPGVLNGNNLADILKKARERRDSK